MDNTAMSLRFSGGVVNVRRPTRPVLHESLACWLEIVGGLLQSLSEENASLSPHARLMRQNRIDALKSAMEHCVRISREIREAE